MEAHLLVYTQFDYMLCRSPPATSVGNITRRSIRSSPGIDTIKMQASVISGIRALGSRPLPPTSPHALSLARSGPTSLDSLWRKRSSILSYEWRERKLRSLGTKMFGSRGSLGSACRAAAAERGRPSEDETPKEYCIVNFYHLVDIAQPHRVVKEHMDFLENKEVRGRIYISEQGINAQYGGLKSYAVGYAEWLAKTQPLFEGLRYSVYPADGHMFPKLRIKYRPNLISLAGGMATIPVTDPSARAIPVKPEEWKRMLSEGIAGRRPVVLDVRNGYEWDAGHFEGAERPEEEEFNQTPTEATPVNVPAPLDSVDEDTPVMMYCTGGIRCDVYSTYLKQKGYKNLYTLEGGIQNYLKSEGLKHWNGSLFVFDGRMAIRPDGDEDAPLEAAVPCQVCGAKAALPHINCANIDCNKLFIACDKCKVDWRGCCCETCMDAPRLLRPLKTKGQYGNWTHYVDSEDEDVALTMSSGRSAGRISRRRKRQQALKEREKAKRALKVERRRSAKEALAKALADRANEPKSDVESLNDRLQKLREHRQSLLSQQKQVL